MKKSYLKRLICLGAAALVLCSALAMAAATGSPYETLKNAIFKGVNIENGTIKAEFDVSIDGVSVQSSKTQELISKDAVLSLNEDGSVSFSSKDFYLYDWYASPTDETWFCADSNNSSSYSSNSFSIDSPMEYMSSAEQRFVELLVDMFVGDLKNNISMYEKDGVRYISGTLTEMQIPEIVNAGFDLIASESSRRIDESDYDYYEDKDFPPPTKIRLTYVHGDAQVDKDGNLTAVSGEAEVEYTDIYDRTRTLNVTLGLELTDIGSTVVECPVPGVAELLDEYKGSDSNYASVRFTLNPDGTINRDSVFDFMAQSSGSIVTSNKEVFNG